MKKLLLLALTLFLSTQVALGATSTFYPDAGTGGTTVDGTARRGGINETFSTIIAGAGTLSDDTSTTVRVFLRASITSNQYDQLRRSILTFDTSSLTAGATISSTVFSLFGVAKANALGSPDIDVVASTPASNNAVVSGDYSQLGSTVFSSITYSSYSISAYNDFTLDANGIANVSKTGISKFGTRMSWDTDGSFGGSWSAVANSSLNAKSADETGTTNDPKLVVEYEAVTSTGFLFLLQ